MTDEKFATEIDLGDGEAAACDMRHADFPLGWTARAESAACTVHLANVARPAATDWTDHVDTPSIDAGDNGAEQEPTPLTWLRFTAGAGGASRVGIVSAGQVVVHRSTDSLAADGGIPDISGLAAGDVVRRGPLDALFAYGGPAGPPPLSYSVASSDATKATAQIVDAAFLEVTAVAAGDSDITVTARGPAGQTADLTFSVTVA